MVQNAGVIEVLVVQDLPNEMIIGIDALLTGKATLNLHHNTMTWFNTPWSLHIDQSHGIAGLSQICPITDIPAINKILIEYAEVFSGPNDPNGFYKANPLRIQTQGVPIYQRAYRTPLNKRQEISKQVDKLLAEGHIRPSCSPWASPVTLVQKQDGTSRMCVDYRQLNAVTKRDRFPLPRIDEILDLMQGSNIFATLDLKSGYHQLAVNSADVEKTAFICHRGQFEYLRVPFGLANAP